MATKRLYKNSNESMIAGVCQGIAEYFDMDPSIVRIIFAASVLFAGSSVILYIVMAIILPEKDEVYHTMDNEHEVYDNYDDY